MQGVTLEEGSDPIYNEMNDYHRAMIGQAIGDIEMNLVQGKYFLILGGDDYLNLCSLAA